MDPELLLVTGTNPSVLCRFSMHFEICNSGVQLLLSYWFFVPLSMSASVFNTTRASNDGVKLETISACRDLFGTVQPSSRNFHLTNHSMNDFQTSNCTASLFKTPKWTRTCTVPS